MHPWVAARRDRVGFGLQVFALPEDSEPTERVLRAGPLADELGFDAFFIGDHPGYQTEPWIHLGTLAATTKQIGLGSVVNCLGHRQPALYARLAGDLDRISHGRAILGLGIGWNVPEFKQHFGLSFPSVRDRQEALDEALQIIDGMFGPEPIDFHGRHYWVEGAHFQHSSVQRPRPPILVAGAGEQVSLRQVARYADACNFGAGSNVGKVTENDGVRAKLATLRRHCEEIGRPYDDILRTHFTSWAMLSTTETGAKAKLDWYYPQGLTPEQRITRIVGTPERVAKHDQGLVDAGMQYFVIQVLDAADEETFTLLATEVLPRLRPLS